MNEFKKTEFDFKKWGAFFAYSNEQFLEGSNGRPNKDFVSIGFGLIALKENVTEFLKAFNEFSESQSKLEKEFYSQTKWLEITEEKYFDMLGCLPPEKYTAFKNGNIFRMSEYYSGNVTAHYKQKDNKYYTKNIDTTSYIDIKEIF